MKKIIYILFLSLLLNFAVIVTSTSFAETTNTTPFKDLNTINVESDIYYSTKYTSFYSKQYMEERFMDSVIKCYNEGIITGTGKTTFSPSLPVTRAMALTVVCRRYYQYLNKDIESTTLPFDDVSANAYYIDYLKMAYASGMVKGTSSNKFSPDLPVDEDTIVAFISRLICSLPDDFPIVSYNDSPGSYDSRMYRDLDDKINKLLSRIERYEYISSWAKDDYKEFAIRVECDKYVSGIHLIDTTKMNRSLDGVSYINRADLAIFMSGNTWNGVVS